MAQELHPQLEELGGRVYDMMLEGKLHNTQEKLSCQ